MRVNVLWLFAKIWGDLSAFMDELLGRFPADAQKHKLSSRAQRANSLTELMQSGPTRARANTPPRMISLLTLKPPIGGVIADCGGEQKAHHRFCLHTQSCYNYRSQIIYLIIRGKASQLHPTPHWVKLMSQLKSNPGLFQSVKFVICILTADRECWVSSRHSRETNWTWVDEKYLFDKGKKWKSSSILEIGYGFAWASVDF